MPPQTQPPNFNSMFSLTPKHSEPESFLEPHFAEPYQAWKTNPTPANGSIVLKAVDPVLKSALRTYSGGQSASPNLRSKAKLIALDSLKRYDPYKSKLQTHLMVNLQGLRRASAEEGQIIGVPERVRLDNHRLHVASTELADRLGRDPSDGELARHTGLSLSRIGHIRKAKTGIAEGSVTGETEDGETTFNAPAVIDRGDDTWLRFVHQDLSPTDQFIMERTLGLHRNSVLPKGEIARRLGISAGAVSQRAARIQKLIDSKDEIAPSFF